MITFLREFEIPLLIIINKIDKVSNLDKNRIITFFLNSAEEFGLNIVSIDNYDTQNKNAIPLLEFSALKKTNLKKLKEIINKFIHKKK